LDGIRQFVFDHSYWSHDGFRVLENGYLAPMPDGIYADQKRVFDDLGRQMVQNAWAGYNCTYSKGINRENKIMTLMASDCLPMAKLDRAKVIPSLDSAKIGELSPNLGMNYSVAFEMQRPKMGQMHIFRQIPKIGLF
jgi:hypothetical protein